MSSSWKEHNLMLGGEADTDLLSSKRPFSSGSVPGAVQQWGEAGSSAHSYLLRQAYCLEGETHTDKEMSKRNKRCWIVKHSEENMSRQGTGRNRVGRPATASKRRRWLSQDLVDKKEPDMGGYERSTFWTEELASAKSPWASTAQVSVGERLAWL